MPWVDASPHARQVSPRPSADKYANKSAVCSHRAAVWHPPPPHPCYGLLISLPAGAAIPDQMAAHFCAGYLPQCRPFLLNWRPQPAGRSGKGAADAQSECLGGRQPRAENGRKAAPLPSASVCRSLPALQALPGISEPRPRLPLTARYFTLETYYTS